MIFNPNNKYNEVMLRICISGSTGKMGRALHSLIHPPLSITGEIHSGSSISDALENSDVIIDFSTPSLTYKLIDEAEKRSIPLVIGTTGLDLKALEKRSIPLLYASNFSRGLALFQQALSPFSHLTPAIDETHCTTKKDTPSGTALLLASLFPDPPIISHRKEGAMPSHTLTFHLPGETVCFTHSVSDRSIYAQGAIDSAIWLFEKSPGLYTFNHVIQNSHSRQHLHR